MSSLTHQPGHAPGWSWRRLNPPTLNPYAHTDPAGTGCTIGGLCENGWHDDCRQLPWTPGHTVPECPQDHPRRCACPCHTDPVQAVLF